MAISLSLLKEKLDYPVELKLLIQELRSEENLSEEIRGFIAMYDSFDGDVVAMKDTMDANRKKILGIESADKTIYSLPRLMKYAAVLCVFAISSFLAYSYWKHPRFEFSSVYVDPGIPTYMSSESESSFESIMFFYKKNEFRQANELIQKALIKKPGNDTLIYYQAIVNYREEKITASIDDFKRIGFSNGVFKNKALYFYAVCLIHQGKYTQAKKILQQVVNCNDENVDCYANKNLKELEKYLSEQ